VSLFVYFINNFFLKNPNHFFKKNTKKRNHLIELFVFIKTRNREIVGK